MSSVGRVGSASRVPGIASRGDLPSVSDAAVGAHEPAYASRAAGWPVLGEAPSNGRCRKSIRRPSSPSSPILGGSRSPLRSSGVGDRSSATLLRARRRVRPSARARSADCAPERDPDLAQRRAPAPEAPLIPARQADRSFRLRFRSRSGYGDYGKSLRGAPRRVSGLLRSTGFAPGSTRISRNPPSNAQQASTYPGASPSRPHRFFRARRSLLDSGFVSTSRSKRMHLPETPTGTLVASSMPRVPSRRQNSGNHYRS